MTLSDIAAAVPPGTDPRAARAVGGERLGYPVAPCMTETETRHGIEFTDSYRPLEDTSAPDTLCWIADERDLATRSLGEIGARERIHARLTTLWNYERIGLPVERVGRLFYSWSDGRREQYSVRVRESDGVERLVLDGNDLSSDGGTSLAAWSPSHDGQSLAYAISRAGSDWWEWRVRDVRTGVDHPDRIAWARYQIALWRGDDAGFFYGRVPAPAGDAACVVGWPELYYHALGTDAADDSLMFGNDGRDDIYLEASLDDSASRLVVERYDMDANSVAIHLVDIDARSTPTCLLPGDGYQYRYIGGTDPIYFVWTNWDAPNWQVIWIDRERFTAGGEQGWGIGIPETNLPLEGARRVGGRLVALYLNDVASEVRILDDRGAIERRVKLPGLGSANGFSGSDASPTTWYSFTSFTQPTAVYRYNVVTGETDRFHRPDVDFDPQRYVTRQVFVRSDDGTRVPMFLSHRRDLPANHALPTYLTGYGGFYTAQRPGFFAAAQAWMELGGIYAVANVRGGSEYSLRWHKGGMRENKQNAFDDFIAAAQWLIDSGRTCRARLAIGGHSNGGLLVGACLTQRPELFGAAIMRGGLFDMLRFHHFTIGRSWVGEYGSPEDPEEFKVLLDYSPLHNVRAGTCYPPTLVVTGGRDDRVPPSHSYKFAAALQAAQAGAAPILLRVDHDTGHGAGTPTSKQIDEWTDIWSFLVEALGMEA